MFPESMGHLLDTRCHCKFVLDPEGICLPSDGPECVVTADSHPPPAWLTWSSRNHRHLWAWLGCLLGCEAHSLEVIHSCDGETKS